MPIVSLRRLLPAVSVGLALALFAGTAAATAVMDMRAEDLVPMAIQFRQELKLTSNQQTLWQQMETRSKAILRERQQRRDKLQAALQGGVAAPKVELRDLDRLVDAEQSASVQEDRQLRAMWLEVNDALDDSQRAQVAAMVGEQLMRVPGPERGAAPGRSDDKGAGRRGGGKRGGMGGPGG